MTSKTEAISPEAFGETPDGKPAGLYTLHNAHLRVCVTDYGGRMVSIEAPDRSGRRADVILGFDDAGEYVRAGGAFGALLGRDANRIADGRFTLDGRSYQLATNDGTSTLHGGAVGFDRVFWKVISAVSGPIPSLILSHLSPDGDQGFPGELSVEATYRLDGDSLWLLFATRTTKPTLVSLSAHAYFNLAGAQNGDVLGHVLTIAADAYLPTDEKQIPTGEIRSVAGTPFDFRQPTALGARVRQADPQLVYGHGYDQCFVLGTAQSAAPRFAARALDPTSGRWVEIYTTQPGMQLYTGNKLDGSLVGRRETIYRQSAGFAFEPQGFPDAPNHAGFPSTILRPDENYQAVIRYRFGAS
jgi:aldose 1-epimerase